MSRLSKPPPGGRGDPDKRNTERRPAAFAWVTRRLVGLCFSLGGSRRGGAMAMNTVEATRIVAVLDDSLEAMR